MFKKLVSMMAMSLILIACESSDPYEKTKSFEVVLEAHTGQSYTIAKYGKFSVYKNDLTGEFVAYNTDKFNSETMLNFEQYMANGVIEGQDIVGNLSPVKEWKETGHYEYYNNDCRCWRSYQSVGDGAGKRWVDTSYWATYYVGSGYKFENNSINSKDLETIAALREEATEALIVQTLKSELSLSDNRAQELAALANKYRRLENVRELTGKEKDLFAMKALGVSMTQVEEALSQNAKGEEEQYKALLDVAAKTNNTTPEQIGRFLTIMMPE